MIENLCPDFQVVKMAKTGKEALDFLKTEPVDVVFTDINMPVVDGLELLEYVSENHPHTAKVVISGYQDFRYAQKALQCGVKNYLVKPVDKKELSTLLGQIREAHSSRETERKKQFLEQVLFGSFAECGQEPDFGPLYPFYLVAKAYCIHSLEEDAASLDVWKDSYLREAQRVLEPAGGNVYPFYGRNPNEILILLETKDEPDCSALAEMILKGKKVDLPLAVSFGPAISDLSRLREEIGRIRCKIYHGWVYGEDQVIRENDERELLSLPERTVTDLCLSIKNRQILEFDRLLTEIRDLMKSARITQDQLEKVLNKIMLCILSNQSVFSDAGLLRNDINDLVLRAGDLDEIFGEFNLWCRKMLLPQEAEDTDALMKRIDEYIMTHYQEPVNTKFLAGEFGLVPPYLSKLFQKYKGLSPNHYIQQIRLEKAEQLLVEYPEMMTKEIAQMTGYADPGYFSKAFKRWSGMYPSEYRSSRLERRA